MFQSELSPANVAQPIRLHLTGLTCQHCVQRVKQSLEQRPDVITAEVTLDQALVTASASAAQLIETVKQAGYEAALIDPKTKPLSDTGEPVSVAADHTAEASMQDARQLLISGMSCASCVSRVQQALQQVAGAEQVQVNLAQLSAWVSGNASEQALLAALRRAGYQGQIVEDASQWRQCQQQQMHAEMRRYGWQALLALLVGIPVMLWGMFTPAMMLTEDNRSQWLWIGGLTLLVLALAGGHYYRNAWKSLLNGTATMDTLVALGTAAAWIFSAAVNLFPQLFPEAARHIYYEACLMIIGLVNLGHLLEIRGRRQSSTALEQLMDLTPATARLVTNGTESSIALAQVQPQMILRLTPGDRVPVDGEITQGEGWIDESMLSGEAGAQHKTPGQLVYAGTLMQDGTLLFRATLTGKTTTLARIIQLVRQAQSSKPALGRMADRISAVFVPLVVCIALGSGALWYVVGPPPQLAYSLVIVTTVLIIACPCALGLATPMSVIAGVARAAKFGILVRDADALQNASRLDTLVFDKTGTLTEGKPQVISIKTAVDFPPEQALQLAAALETASGHPLAQAIKQKAGELSLPVLQDIRTLPGQGVRGMLGQTQLLLGSQSWLEEQQIDSGEFTDEISRQAGQGATPVLLAADKRVVALFIIRDPLRNDTISALHRLRQLGYRLVMLTGDNPLTAATVAKEAGISEVIAGVLPQGKAAAIAELQQQGRQVAMIGDGINDAPALAQAQVGIALSGGSDIAVETASLTLMRHNLSAVADGLLIAKATLRNMKQNLSGAFIYNIIAIPVAAGILWPFSETLLNPIIASAAMALSSITVVANANRLLRYKPRG